jgi:MoaA/NifB/PqqE/SkfB family radical SAM enzyme
MLTINDVKKIELEITSDCNAACPGCARTIHSDLLRINSFSLQDLQRIFPTTNHIADKEFKFCGVLGDPAIHPQLADMLEYVLQHGGKASISTNGAVGTADMWRRIGKLANQYRQKFFVQWCIDGHKETNHIYRVNTKWSVLERNMNAFCETVGEYTHRAQWVFIVFDHNEHELDIAKQHAKRLGFKFATRTGMRNSYNNWVAELGKKNNKQKKVITTTGDKEHKRKDEVYKLDKLIANNEVDNSIINTISCKYVHEGEMFINSQQQMWPCCFLWDSAFKGMGNILEKLSEYTTGWNSLREHSIEEIMQHPWYDKVLEESWNPTHNKHMKRCIRTCAYNKAYQNVLVEQK